MIDVESGFTVAGHKSSEGEEGRTAADIEREMSREIPAETEEQAPSPQETD